MSYAVVDTKANIVLGRGCKNRRSARKIRNAAREKLIKESEGKLSSADFIIITRSDQHPHGPTESYLNAAG